MEFIDDENTERLADDSTSAISSTKLIKLRDGSVHKVTVVNSLVLESLNAERESSVSTSS